MDEDYITLDFDVKPVETRLSNFAKGISPGRKGANPNLSEAWGRMKVAPTKGVKKGLQKDWVPRPPKGKWDRPKWPGGKKEKDEKKEKDDSDVEKPKTSDFSETDYGLDNDDDVESYFQVVVDPLAGLDDSDLPYIDGETTQRFGANLMEELKAQADAALLTKNTEFAFGKTAKVGNFLDKGIDTIADGAKERTAALDKLGGKVADFGWETVDLVNPFTKIRHNPNVRHEEADNNLDHLDSEPWVVAFIKHKAPGKERMFAVKIKGKIGESLLKKTIGSRYDGDDADEDSTEDGVPDLQPVGPEMTARIVGALKKQDGYSSLKNTSLSNFSVFEVDRPSLNMPMRPEPNALRNTFDRGDTNMVMRPDTNALRNTFDRGDTNYSIMDDMVVSDFGLEEEFDSVVDQSLQSHYKRQRELERLQQTVRDLEDYVVYMDPVIIASKKAGNNVSDADLEDVATMLKSMENMVERNPGDSTPEEREQATQFFGMFNSILETAKKTKMDKPNATNYVFFGKKKLTPEEKGVIVWNDDPVLTELFSETQQIRMKRTKTTSFDDSIGKAVRKTLENADVKEDELLQLYVTSTGEQHENALERIHQKVRALNLNPKSPNIATELYIRGSRLWIVFTESLDMVKQYALAMFTGRKTIADRVYMKAIREDQVRMDRFLRSSMEEDTEGVEYLDAVTDGQVLMEQTLFGKVPRLHVRLILESKEDRKKHSTDFAIFFTGGGSQSNNQTNFEKCYGVFAALQTSAQSMVEKTLPKNDMYIEIANGISPVSLPKISTSTCSFDMANSKIGLMSLVMRNFNAQKLDLYKEFLLTDTREEGMKIIRQIVGMQ